MSSTLDTTLNLSVVAPAYNEHLGISEFIAQVSDTFAHLESRGWSTRLIIVDDGSKDETWQKINETNCLINLTLIRLSRNFGHQTAVWAGLENLIEGEFAVVMDSDLQDSPHEILDIAAKFQEGFDCIFMRRQSRQDGFIKRNIAKAYYKLISKLSSSAQMNNVHSFE
jgi:dolichol-phosphate mannosyltransferase